MAGGETHEVKVALITGGADGMGLAIAQALVAESEQGGGGGCKWNIHLVDVKPEEEAGRHAVASLLGLSSPSGSQAANVVVYHQADVADYAQLAAVFRAAFLGGDGGQRRLDWVFANAGVFERTKYFADDDEPPSKDRGDDNDEPPPPPPDYKALEVNLQGAVNTVHLARHYISRSTAAGGGEVEGEGGSGSIVVTASCSSFWPTYWAPIYTASKFGILGFVRAVAGHFFHHPQPPHHRPIRVNALCPGAMRTAIVPEAAWAPFPDDVFTDLRRIADVALALARGDRPVVDHRGVAIVSPGAYGQAVVANGPGLFLGAEPAYCDEAMRRTMESTRVKKH